MSEDYNSNKNYNEGKPNRGHLHPFPVPGVIPTFISAVDLPKIIGDRKHEELLV